MPWFETLSGGGGGGSVTETVLWTNPNTSSDFADTTLTDLDFSGYDGIRFYWKYHKSYNDSSATHIDVTKADWDNMGGSAQTCPSLALYNGSALYSRHIYKLSTTSIRICPDWRVNVAGTANSNNIPIKICGLKKTSGGGFDISSPDVTYAGAFGIGTVTIAVTKMPKKIIGAQWCNTDAASGQLFYVDVENQQAWRSGYWSSASKDFQVFNWSDVIQYFTTISSSEVVYKKSTWSSSSRSNIWLWIYY